MQKLQSFLVANGYHRSETVREAGEYALRGGLIDIFPAGAPEPLRIDCFGDDIEHIRSFDALSQRTIEDKEKLNLYAVSEVLLTPEAIESFRSKYRELFGAVRKEDALYESISEGRKYAGMEHWLPLYYERLETLFDYVPEAAITLDSQTEQSREMRLQQVEDLYQARVTMLKAEQKDKPAQYRPVPVASLYLPQVEWEKKISGYEAIDLSPFSPTPGGKDGGGKKGRDFGDIRAQTTIDLYETIREHIEALMKPGKKVLVAAYSAGSRDRLIHLLKETGPVFYTHNNRPLTPNLSSPRGRRRICASYRQERLSWIPLRILRKARGPG